MTAAQYIIDFVAEADDSDEHHTLLDDEGVDVNSLSEFAASTQRLQQRIVDVADFSVEVQRNAHTLLLRKAILGTDVDDYFCLECNVAFESIEAFNALHHMSEEMLETQWEVLDEELPTIAATTATKQNKLNLLAEQQQDEEQQDEEQQDKEQQDEEQQDEEQQQYFEILEDENLQFVKKEEPTEVEHNKQFAVDKNIKDEQQHFQLDQYYCYDCEEMFESFDEANTHACSKYQTRHVCVHCRAEFLEFVDLQAHQKYCKEAMLQQTTKAATAGSPVRKLKSVQKQQEQQQQLEKQHNCCHICNTSFSCAKNLKLHMKIHNKRAVKSIQAALPAAMAKDYNQLDQFFCQICNKFFDHNLLAVHQNMHQSVDDYNCGICNRKFENLCSYELHLQMHNEKTGSKRFRPVRTKGMNNEKYAFPCQYCERSFPRPHEKVNHERVHTGEKPYDCEVCGKKFRTAYSLTLHLRTHTDIRPYVCATCNKRFKSQPVYAHHLKTHETERNYKCTECPKAFRTSVQLCAHQNSHKKPFSCPDCNRPFASLYAVKAHMKKTHSRASVASNLQNLRYYCKACGAVYVREFALKAHISEQHPEMAFEQQQQQQQHLHNDNAVEVENTNEDDTILLVAAAANYETSEMLQMQDASSSNCAKYVKAEQELPEEEEFQTEEIITDWLSA